jgi:hypothetical protein
MLSVGSLHEEAQLCKESTTPPPSVDILIVFGDRPSGFSDRGLASRVEGNQNPIPTSWEQVLLHLGEKVNWEAKESGRWDIAWRVDTESSFLHTPKPADIILGFGLEDPKWSAVALHELQDVPRVVMFFDCVKFVDGLAQVGAYRPTSVTSQLQAWFLPGQTRKDKDTYSLCQQLFGRRTTEDLLYSILVLINAFFVPLPFVDKTMKSDLPQQREIIKTCQKQLVACAKSPECRKTLQCLLRCAQNDQVCTYRCITSYENEAFANFALCILHRNNILGLNATIPVYPQLTAMQTFRGEALTWNSAETILRGWLGPEAYSWLVVAGVNPAYDHFPAQHQLFYSGKASGTFWYDPVFLCETLDGRQEWRRRNYRCRRDGPPGAYLLSTLDNGVVSSESWRIIDAADDLSFVLLHYKGAARVVGQRYRGAVLGSRTGRVAAEHVPRIEAALRRCGIRPWELFPVLGLQDLQAIGRGPQIEPPLYLSQG